MSTKVRRAAIYARKSTEQGGPPEARSVARQVEGARAWVEARGWLLEEAHVYKDDGVSGYLFLGRPAFQAMMRAAEAHAFDALVLYDLDRFGRNSRRTMEALYALADAGVQVWDYSTGQPVGLDNEGELITLIKSHVAEQKREGDRKKTRDAMRAKAGRGEWPASAPYGYHNVLVRDRKDIEIDEQEAEVVRAIYRRFAAGQRVAAILRWLNTQGFALPRGERGWANTTLRRWLRNPLYRGELVYGATGMVYGREAPKGRERAQLPRPEEEHVKSSRPDLRLVDEATVAAVGARLAEEREAYERGKAAGRAPHKGRGHYLLSGGLLKCPDCGGNFETRHARQGGRGGTCRCATRRDDPSKCQNRLSLPMHIMDAAVLNALADEKFGERYINELLSLVESAPADEGERLAAERDRLRGEVTNLVRSVAKGMPADTIAPVVKEYEAEIAKLEVEIARPRRAAPDKVKLRAALGQLAVERRAALRAEPEVARAMIRRLIGPITLWKEENVPGLSTLAPGAHIKKGRAGKANIGLDDILIWGADIKPEAIAEGLVEVPVSRWRS